MNSRVSITVLVENTVNVRGLRAEHGLSFLIRSNGRKVLFDTGQTDLFAQNARSMGLALDGLDAIVLSHGHYDHTGGLTAARAESPLAPVYLHPDARKPKFARNADGTSRSIGMSEESLGSIGSAAVCTLAPAEILDGLCVTGPVPRENNFEDTGGDFFLDAACTRADPLLDDQALFFDTSKGVVLVMGCGHSGIVNTLGYVAKVTSGRPVRAVVGGMHLLGASPDRMRQTLKAITDFNPAKLYPGHCTGAAATARIWAAFPDRCGCCAVGTTITFDR
jgi:7,8-dihydropterin-6-yl-methyl-4-(beta-D-ribofuranosyl)aminobenzene 5'-phosphate synthase